MRRTNRFYGSIFMFLTLLFTSCENEKAEEFEQKKLVPCEDKNVVKKENIISDFECQSNIKLKDVETVRNPAEIQINKSKFVGKYIDSKEEWGNLVIDYGKKIDLFTNGLFKIKVRTKIGGKMIVKLEGGTSKPIERNNTVTGDNGWKEYQFNFSSQAKANHKKVIIFFNAGVATAGTDIYYIDDLLWDKSIDPCEGVSPDTSIVSDFECQQNFFLGDPKVAISAPVVENPDKTGANTSEFVGKFTDDGKNAWDNLIIDLKKPIDLSQKSQLKIKVHSTKKVPLLAKLEGGTKAVEVWSSIDEVGKWVEYTFDFRAAAGKGNTKIVLFFNGGKTDGTKADVYYIDEIKFAEWSDPCLGISPNKSIISDFECQQNYFLGDGTSKQTIAQVVANPHKSGINTSSTVGKFIDNGQEAWNKLIVDFKTPIDLSQKSQLKIKIYSTKKVPLLAKLEGGTTKQISANITEINKWVEYAFDFRAAKGGKNTKVVLFFNAGKTDGTKADVYYIDDYRFAAESCDELVQNCSGVKKDESIISDFDCQENFFLGDKKKGIKSAPKVKNPKISCENRSSNVGKFTDDGKNAWDNLIIDLEKEIDLSAKNILKFKVLSTKAVPIMAKIEGGTAAEFKGNITVTDKWVEYAFDFSKSKGKKNTKVVIFFNAGQTDGTSTDVYYVDDIRFDTP